MLGLKTLVSTSIIMIKEIGAWKFSTAIKKAGKRAAFTGLKEEYQLSKNQETSINLDQSRETPELPLVTSFGEAYRNPKSFLPPISNAKEFQGLFSKSFQTTQEFKNEKPQEFLLYGDIVTLIAKETNSDYQYSGIVNGDGISQSYLECVPKKYLVEANSAIQVRQSLFRVEPARQYGHLKTLKEYQNSDQKQESTLKKLESLVKEESECNEADLETTTGDKVRYGDRIQLRHIHSECFITTKLKVARETGCLEVVLDEEGSESSWFEIVPKSKLRHEGEPIGYSDLFLLKQTVEKSTYYLHMGVQQEFKVDIGFELNSGSLPTDWKAHKYISHAQTKKNPELVSSGNSFKILNKQTGGFLTVNSCKIEEILPYEIQSSADNFIQTELNKNSVFNSRVYIDNRKGGMDVWELERKNVFDGGVVKHQEVFRIKHALTGLYLGVLRNGNIILTQEGKNEVTLFKITSESNSSLTFKSLVKIESVPAKRVLKAQKPNMDTLDLFKSEEEFLETELELTSDRKNFLTSFSLEDVPEEKTIYLFQISRVIPKLVNFYQFLANWALVKRNHIYVPNYEKAKETENQLEKQTEICFEILSNIQNKILKNQEKEKQDSVRESGLLELLVKMLQLIDKRLKLPSKFPRENLPPSVKNSNLKKISWVVRFKTFEYLTFPSAIAIKYLNKLASKIYRVIHIAVKNNKKSSRSIMKHEEFLTSQLSSYKIEVGSIIKSAFKHCFEVTGNTQQVTYWTDKVSFINEEEDNIVEQTMKLKILSSLCIYKGKAIPRYQNALEKQLPALNLVEFFIVNNKPCVKLLPGKSTSVEKFMSLNPTLQRISVPQDSDSRVPNLFYVESFTPYKQYVDYLAAFLQLLTSICISRNEENTQSVVHNFNLSFEHAFIGMENPSVHCKIRKYYSAVCNHLFIDKSPQTSLLQSKNNCYFWNHEEQKIEFISKDFSFGLVNSVKQFNHSSLPVAGLADWLERFWTEPTSPFANWKYETYESRIKFVIEILELSYKLLDFQLISGQFIFSVSNQLVYLLKNWKKGKSVPHWCANLKSTMKVCSKDLNDKLVLKILKLLELKCELKNKHLTQKVLEDLKESDLNSLNQKLLIELDFRKFKEVQETQSSKTSPMNIFKKSNALIHPGYELVNQKTDEIENKEFLDKVILNLLFKSKNTLIKDSALKLLFKQFRQKHNLKNDLQKVLLVSDGELKKTYSRLSFLNEKLVNCTQKLKHQCDIKTDGYSSHLEVKNLKMYLTSSLEELKTLLKKQAQITQLKYLQTMMLNLKLHENLMIVLKLDWPWVTFSGSKKVISSKMARTYRLITRCLSFFVHKNPENQRVIYESIEFLFELMGNQVGVTRLVSQILVCKRNSNTSMELIPHLFLLVASGVNNQSKHQELRVLRSFVHDEQDCFYSTNQTTLIKLIAKSQLVRLVTEKLGGDFTKLSIEETDFHVSLVSLLGACAVNNLFATQQCRRILKKDSLLSYLNLSPVPFRVKKSYLHFLFYVHCMKTSEIERTLNLEELKDTLQEVVLRDLESYPGYLEYLEGLSAKGLYKVVPKSYSEPQETGIEKIKSMFATFIGNTKKPLYIKPAADELSKEELEALEFWNYLTSYVPFSSNIGKGLLCFIKDLSREIKKSGQVPHIEMIKVLEFIRVELQSLHDDLYSLKFLRPHLMLDFLIKQVQEASIEIPYFVIETQEGEKLEPEEEEKCFLHLFECLVTYVSSNKIPFEEFKSKNLGIKEGGIRRDQFIAKIKEFLKNDIRTSQIDKAMNYLDPEGGETILLNFLIKELKDYFIRNPYTVKRKKIPAVSETSLQEVDINKWFQNQVNQLHSLSEQETKNETIELFKKVKSLIFDKNLTRSYSFMQELLENLKVAFRDNTNQIYFLQVLKYLLKIEMKNPESSKRIEVIQKVYTKGRIMEMALSFLNKSNPKILVKKALQLLNTILLNNNPFVKDHLLNYLKTNENYFGVFIFFKEKIKETSDYLFGKQKEIQKVNTRVVTLRTVGNLAEIKSVNHSEPGDPELTCKIIRFLQLCCDNCYLPFQNFLGTQNLDPDKANVDLVQQLSLFMESFKNLSVLKDPSKEPNEVCKLASQGFKTLIDMCTGPCLKNQEFFGNRRRLFRFINWLIDVDSVNDLPGTYILIFSEAVKFLKTLTEGHNNKKIYKVMFEEINFSLMKTHANSIWSKRIQGREEVIYQENQGKSYWLLDPLELKTVITEEDFKFIEVGFDIYILILTLHSYQPKLAYSGAFEDNEELIGQNEMQNIQKGVAEMEEMRDKENFKDSLVRGVKNFCYYLKITVNPSSFYTQRAQNEAHEAYKFYSANISFVEINNNSQLIKCYFRVPFMCKYISKASRENLVLDIQRTTYQEKLEDFLNNSKVYQVEMKHQQKLARYPLIDDLACKWRVYADFSYLLVVVLNLLMLFSVEHESGNTGSWKFTYGGFYTLMTPFAAIQVLLAFMIYFFYIVEYYPVISYKKRSESGNTDSFSDSYERVSGTVLMKQIGTEQTSTKNKFVLGEFFSICFLDRNNFYNLVYLLISALAWRWPLLYTVLLLDVIKRSQDLVNILNSITLNYSQLLRTMVFGVILVYMFSVVAFAYFADYYLADSDDAEMNTYCDSLLDCFTSTLIVGFRAGGGIGEWIGQAAKDQDYWARIIFDNLFFILIVVIVTNIIFGIIIDTFAELRDRKNAKLTDMRENCLICGKKKFQFEVQKIDWNSHLNVEHNAFAYLAFIIHIRHKPIEECNGAEKFVKERIEIADTKFFPTSSLSLNEDQEEEPELFEYFKTQIQRLSHLAQLSLKST